MKLFFKMGCVPAMMCVLMAAPIAHAASSPNLGTAASFSVLGAAAVSTANPTTVTGDLGLSPGLAVSKTGTWVVGGSEYYGPLTVAGNAQTDALAAFNNLAGQTSTGGWGVSPWSPLPGVYTAALDQTFTGTITLNGGYNDVWVFQVGRDMTFSGSIILAGNAQACHVFFQVGRDTVVAIGSSLVGTLITSGNFTSASGATVNGRIISLNGTFLAMNGVGGAISGPTCVVAPSASSPTIPPLINVRKVPSPLALPAGPGPVIYHYTVTNPGSVALTNVTLTDDKCSAVTFVSGDTNGDGLLDTSETWLYTCSTTLTQTTINYATASGIGNGMSTVDTAVAEVVVGVPVIPPLINIIKTPNPLTLPFSGGPVTYSYAVTNPGTVALTGVTVTDDKCSNPTYVSGDTNGDLRLQSTETWRYTCTANIPLTTTNTAVATGHANGLTAVDTALATVVTAGSPVPPLIHVVKKPVPVILPAGGGAVTYTYVVTNPGTVPLSGVTVADDTCSAVTSISGDANGNGLLDTNETWTYTCQQNLTATTTNTATATGHANGLTVTDVSVANVVLSPALIVPAPAPTLPNTGFDPNGATAAWIVVSAGIFVAGSLLFVLIQHKRLS